MNLWQAMKLLFEGTLQEFRDVLERLGCKPKNQERLFVIVEGQDEPIPKGQRTMLVKLSKPIKPGFRRPISVVPDAPVDAREDGSFAGIESVEGDSTGTIRPESTATEIKAYVNGDGSIGTKLLRLTVDGHVGQGDVPVTLDLAYEVAHPDATAFGPLVEGEDEQIPAPPA